MLFKNKKCPNCGSYHDPTLEQCPICHKDNELYTNRCLRDSTMFCHPAAQIGLFLAGFGFAGMILSEIIGAFFFAGVANKELKYALILLFTYLLMLSALIVIAFSSRQNIFIKKFELIAYPP